MLRAMLLVTAGVFVTAGLLAVAWCVAAILGGGWRPTSDLATPAVGIGGVALIVAAAVALRLTGRTGRPGDPAHAIDAATDES